MDLNLTQRDWPEVKYQRTDVRPSPRFSGLREARPLFSRRPYEDWCRIYRNMCEDDDVLDWQDAGFARCTPDQLEVVNEAFRRITQQTNEAFREFLAGVLVNRPSSAQGLIAFEGSMAASEDGEGHLCGFSSLV